MNKELIETALNIRYVKLHFSIQFINDCKLPINKPSAIRGGIGEMLLRANCINNRDCDACDFESECMVQRTMYSRYEIHPEGLSVGNKNSIGYVIECENYETDFYSGEELSFNLILFGKTIVYFNQYMMALYSLGQNGLGKDYAKFVISSVTNTRGEHILDGSNVYMKNYRVENLREYVNYRLSTIIDEPEEVIFATPVTIKYKKNFMQDFDSNAIVEALKRRIYLLDCFEGKDININDEVIEIPVITDSQKRPIDVKRYSNRQDAKMTLKGIKGKVEFDSISEELLWLLLAAEITHIGKNTSFGFGRIRVK